MKFRLNKRNLVPDVKEYLKILISSFIVVYGFKKVILYIFPSISNFPDFWALVFWVAVITYFKDLIDMKWNGRDYF